MGLDNDYQWLLISKKERKSGHSNGSTLQLLRSSLVKVKLNVNLIKSLELSLNEQKYRVQRNMINNTRHHRFQMNSIHVSANRLPKCFQIFFQSINTKSSQISFTKP